MSIETKPDRSGEDQQPFGGGPNTPKADEQSIRGPSEATASSTIFQSGKEDEPDENRMQAFTIPENPLDERYRSNRFAHVLRELLYWHKGLESSFEYAPDFKEWRDTDLRWYDNHLAVGAEWAAESDERADFVEHTLEDVINHIDRLTAALRSTDEPRLTQEERPILTAFQFEPYARVPQRPRQEARHAEIQEQLRREDAEREERWRREDEEEQRRTT